VFNDILYIDRIGKISFIPIPLSLSGSGNWFSALDLSHFFVHEVLLLFLRPKALRS
jgi:hypothetical protein